MSVFEELLVSAVAPLAAALLTLGVETAVSVERTPPVQAEAAELAALREEGR